MMEINICGIMATVAPLAIGVVWMGWAICERRYRFLWGAIPVTILGLLGIAGYWIGLFMD